MKKTTMKRIAAAVAALCICSMAVAPTVASAATIKITDSATNSVKLENKTFEAYRIFDVQQLSDTEYKYTVADKWEAFFIKKLNITETDADGKIVLPSTFDVDAAAILTADGFDVKAFAKEAYAFAQATGITYDATTTATTAGGTYSATATTETAIFKDITAAGYYMIADVSENANDALSAVILNTLKTADGDDKSVEVNLKADQPTIRKKIVDKADTEGATDQLVDVNTAYIGEDVKYQLDSKVPNHADYYAYEYIITDTIDTGLTFNKDVVVKIGGGEALTEGTHYTVTYTDAEKDAEGESIAKGHEEKMVITILNMKNYDIDDEIVVTYSAEVNKNAVVDATGEDGNVNTVKLTYSNDPNHSGDIDGDGTPDGEDDDIDGDGTPDDKDNDDDGDGTPDGDDNTPEGDTPTTDTPEDKVITYLTKFQIVKENNAGEKLPGAVFTITGDNGYKSGDLTTDENGLITVNGIGAGVYTITEKQAPAGYNGLDSSFEFTVGSKMTQDGEELTILDTKIVYGDNADEDVCAWSYNYGGTDTLVKASDATITVKNNAGALFPTTGGIGTTIFTVLGVSLMAGAAGAFAIKRKAMNK